jgi:hypothetical protein
MRANLPALGFNTYYFEAKRNILFFIVDYKSTKIITFVLATQENEEPKIKITTNDECILQNQVRQTKQYVTTISSIVSRIFELKSMLRVILNI